MRKLNSLAVRNVLYIFSFPFTLGGCMHYYVSHNVQLFKLMGLEIC